MRNKNKTDFESERLVIKKVSICRTAVIILFVCLQFQEQDQTSSLAVNLRGLFELRRKNSDFRDRDLEIVDPFNTGKGIKTEKIEIGFS